MEKDKIKQIFHILYNKINNIFLVVSSNKELINEKEMNNISVEEFKNKVSYFFMALGRIEDNTQSINMGLQELYKLLFKEDDSQSTDSLK